MKHGFCPISRAISTIAVVIALFIVGCQPRPPARKAPEVVRKPEETLLARAESDFEKGKFDAALAEYERYLKEYPMGKGAWKALYRMAEVHIYRHNYEKALTLLERIETEYPGISALPGIQYETAHIDYMLGNYQRSREKLLKWIQSHPESPLTGHIFFLLARNLEALQDKPGAFHWYLSAAALFAQSPEMQKEIEKDIVDLIEGAVPSELDTMQAYARGSKLAPPLYYGIAKNYLRQDMFEQAKAAAMSLVRSSPEQVWVDIGREILEKANNELSVKPNVIGCLLPLSGPFAIYGQELLNGIELGMDLFNSEAGDNKLELAIEDTFGKERETVMALQNLVLKDNVIAVIGPLVSKPALAAARKAQELGVPIITFTQREGITQEGDMVFRNFMTPSKEVDSVLERVSGSLELKSFAVLYPDNRYGHFFMNLFWDKVEELGGSITAVESYEPDETDFATQIKKMVGLYYPRPEPLVQFLQALKFPQYEVEGAEIDLSSLKEPDPIVDFDAVFIPDNSEHIALIAPQFPFHNVFDIRLLGTSLWQSPQLVEMAGDYLQGAIFPSGFFPQSENESVKKFMALYEENFESAPGILAATGYDTIRVLKTLLSQQSIRTRKQLQKALLSPHNFDGVTGQISFDSSGEVVKKPLLLTVSGHRMVPLP